MENTHIFINKDFSLTLKENQQQARRHQFQNFSTRNSHIYINEFLTHI